MGIQGAGGASWGGAGAVEVVCVAVGLRLSPAESPRGSNPMFREVRTSPASRAWGPVGLTRSTSSYARLGGVASHVDGGRNHRGQPIPVAGRPQPGRPRGTQPRPGWSLSLRALRHEPRPARWSAHPAMRIRAAPRPPPARSTVGRHPAPSRPGPLPARPSTPAAGPPTAASTPAPAGGGTDRPCRGVNRPARATPQHPFRTRVDQLRLRPATQVPVPTADLAAVHRPTRHLVVGAHVRIECLGHQPGAARAVGAVTDHDRRGDAVASEGLADLAGEPGRSVR